MVAPQIYCRDISLFTTLLKNIESLSTLSMMSQLNKNFAGTSKKSNHYNVTTLQLSLKEATNR